MNAEEMKLLTTMARRPCKGILKEIKQRALNGYLQLEYSKRKAKELRNE